MLISQPGSDYQITQITIDAGNARDIMLMLIDVHGVLDHLYLDGRQPQITAPAAAFLRESASPYTLPSLISGLDDVITLLIASIRASALPISPAPRHVSQRPHARVGPDQRRTSAPRTPPGGAESKKNSGAKSA